MRYLLLSVLVHFAGHAAAQADTLKAVNVNYMTRGYFYASSAGPEYLNGLGGWGDSDNPSRPADPIPGRTGLEVIVDTTTVVPLVKKYRGQAVVVRNNGPDTIFFPAQDSRLYVKAQVLRGSSFKDIEYFPSSWCGNSYHTLFLA